MRLPWILLPVFLSMTLAGCQPPSATSSGVDLSGDVQNGDPAVRLSACVRAGDLKDSQSVPYLVDRLSDSEYSVRFYAILALEKITGTRMGYEYYLPSYQRASAIEWWRAWLDAGRPPIDQWLKKITAESATSAPASQVCPASSPTSHPSADGASK